MTYFYKLQDRTDLDNPSTLTPPIIGKCLIERLRAQHEIDHDEALLEHYQAAEGDYRFITETPSGIKTRYSLYSKDGEWHALRCDSSIPR
ncbi:hypothetical protein FACS1894184_09470 [Clostridia bacterium]|nr:hypothetical protein FACS1894184_09470 [Clostridia bacterium]